MADVSRIVSIVFAGKDDVSKTARQVGYNLDTLSSSVEDLSKPFAKLTDYIIDADKALVALSGAGLAYAYRESVNYESALVGLNKVLDENTESLDDAKLRASEFSDTYGVAFTDIIAQTTQFKQAGFSLKDSFNLVENALKLMIAGDVEATEASQILVRTLKGLGEEAGFSKDIIETLNFVSNNYAANVSQLGEALARSAPLAKTYGLNLKETIGILTPIVEVFQDSEQAATAFRSGLANLKDDTASVTEAFVKLGFSQEEIANRQLRSTKDILLDVSKRFKDLDINMQGVVSAALFGKENFAKMSAALNNMGAFAKIAGADVTEMSIALEKELTARLASSQIQIDRFINSFQNLAAAIGDQFRAAATNAIGGLADLETELRKSIDAGTFEPLFNVLDDALDKMGAYFKQIAEILPEALAEVDFTELISEIQGISDEIGDFFSGLDLTTAEGLAEAFQKVTDTLASLVRVSVGIAEQFKPFFQSIAEGINQVNDLDRESAKAFGNFLGSAKLVADAGAVIAGAFFAIQKSGSELKAVFDVVVGSAKVFVNLLQIAFDGLATSIVSSFDVFLPALQSISKLPGIPDSFTKSINGAVKGIQEFKAAIRTDAGKQFNDFLAGGEQVWDGITGKTREATTATKEAGEAVKEAGKELEGLTVAEFKAQYDQTSFNAVKEKIDATVPEKKNIPVTLTPKLDKKEIEDDTKALESKIKASSEVIQTRIEWQAKLDIAEVEANAKQIESIAETITEAMKSSGDLIDGLFGSLLGLGGSVDDIQKKWAIQEQLEAENKLREEQLKLQKELVTAQVDYMDARTRMLDRGEALVNITVDSALEPALALIFDEIMKYTQVRATQEGFEGLLGF
jgi:TP901 family phage tail tape measure protein